MRFDVTHTITSGTLSPDPLTDPDDVTADLIVNFPPRVGPEKSQTVALEVTLSDPALGGAVATLEIWGIDEEFLAFTDTGTFQWAQAGSRPPAQAYKLLGAATTVVETVQRIADIWPEGRCYVRAITPTGSGVLTLKFRQLVA